MKRILITRGHWYLVIACLLLAATSCKKTYEDPPNQLPDLNHKSNIPAEKTLKGEFEQVNIVSDTVGFNPLRLDPILQNAWGLAFAPSGPAWVNANETGMSAVFNTAGADIIPPVAIPSPGSPLGGGHPTGIVFNGSSGFRLPNGKPARFIFVGEDGIISGWNGGAVAIQAKDNSADAIYKGLAIAADGTDSFIYAANFKTGQIDVYDTAWSKVSNKLFRDFFIPPGYAPFNIQNVNNNIFVMYAQVGDGGDEVDGPGKGFVDVYRANGRFLRRFATRGVLNAPWGVTMAPDSWLNKKWDGDDDSDDKGKGNPFERHRHHEIRKLFLIGNFGDGTINAFNQDGEFVGKLRANGKAITIEGLWALSFAPSTATSIDPNWLFFTAGPDDEEHGLFGYIKKN
jgi:uncharacterized protein (TIGR03118 family)